ncbi:CAP domain-containing protein [Actinoplanes sp. DH11]|uniref:CAP domain-containing protein n=1 Tax=Actinoplanes sp. DH11 TaxID=2857011 RepID=UPI0027BA18FD|nr:CAP domain-containing protein [Actinoplanes sp. DH11]
MRNVLRRFALAVVLTPAAVGVATMIATPAQAAPAKASETALQNQINQLINTERTQRGCSALKVNAALTAAARGHSAWMAQTGKFSHTGRSNSNFVARSKAAGYTKPSAENIAWGYRSATQVVNGWMNSPGHRTNILNCKSKTVGVGVVFSANGAPYYTQDFGY